MDNIDKYERGFKEKFKPKYNVETGESRVNPFVQSHVALRQASFAKVEREQFFDEAFIDILSELFTAWIKSEPHAVKEREFLYHTALALGSVKERLIKYEMAGKNASTTQLNEDESEDGSE